MIDRSPLWDGYGHLLKYLMGRRKLKCLLTVGNAVLACGSLVEVHMGEEEEQKNCLQ